jgi:hypothetical protein
MTLKSGFVAWPPQWTTTRHDPADRPFGEIGILEQAMMNQLFDNKLLMFINHQGHRYLGSMHLDDRAFCSELLTLLKFNVGRSIKEIGDIDLSSTL